MKLDAANVELTRLRSLFHLREGAAGIADRWQRLVKEHQVSGKQVRAPGGGDAGVWTADDPNF